MDENANRRKWLAAGRTLAWAVGGAALGVAIGGLVGYFAVPHAGNDPA
jgi:ABC-type Fe3+ transport system permease subunit